VKFKRRSKRYTTRWDEWPLVGRIYLLEESLLRASNIMKVIASEAKQSRSFDTYRLPRRPDTSGLLAMTKNRFFREKAILLEALNKISIIYEVWDRV